MAVPPCPKGTRVIGFLEQTVNGLVNGGFYAMLALGLAVIFGMLGVVNFAHGAFYMVGAYGAYVALHSFGLPFWWALALVPAVLFLAGMLLERTLIARLTKLDPLYNFLFTFGLTLMLQSAITQCEPIVTRSPSVTCPANTVSTSIDTSRPASTLPRTSTRAGSASVTPASSNASACSR